MFKGYPNLYVQFDTKEFLEGAPLDQMNMVTAGVKAGIITPNEAREYLGMAQIEGADKLAPIDTKQDKIPGSSPQDTGGGGGSR